MYQTPPGFGRDLLKQFIMKYRTMTRAQVYATINGEREYQQRETEDPTRPDMVEDFDMSKALLAIIHMTNRALETWYSESQADNYQGTLEYIRKITAMKGK